MYLCVGPRRSGGPLQGDVPPKINGIGYSKFIIKIIDLYIFFLYSLSL